MAKFKIWTLPKLRDQCYPVSVNGHKCTPCGVQISRVSVLARHSETRSTGPFWRFPSFLALARNFVRTIASPTIFALDSYDRYSKLMREMLLNSPTNETFIIVVSNFCFVPFAVGLPFLVK